MEPQRQLLGDEIAKLRAIEAPSTEQYRAGQIAAHEETLRDLGPVWRLVDAVAELLDVGHPALSTLPWGADWLLRLAKDRPRGTTYRTSRTRVLNVFGGASIRTMRFQPRDPNFPPVEVDWSESREETRQRLVAAVERLFHERYAAEQGLAAEPVPDAEALRRDRRFRRWLKKNEAWEPTTAALEEVLDQSHPRGSRPYTRDPLRQVRRDVAIWAQLCIEGRSALEVSGDHAERYEYDPAFLTYSGGRGPRLPRTVKGVKDAAGRAYCLLQQREV